MSQGTIVIALGGNAMLQRGEAGSYEGQLKNVQAAAEQIILLRDLGWNVVLTSGNGPQVGAIQLQTQTASHVAPEMPLHVCGAMSQGFIAYMITMCIGNILRARGEEAKVAGIITQSVVSEEDPAFVNPTKPVGRFYTEEEAMEIRKTGKQIREDAGRGWRVVVPSPQPLEIVEQPAIERLVADGFVVVSTCGGGIPVLRKAGVLEGVNAVIDKDLATSLLAREIAADHLCILTDVKNVAINYGKPDQQTLGRVEVSEMERYLAEGHFAPGSMAPKVRAAIQFVRATGKPAIITSLFSAVGAVRGECGTVVIP